MIKYVRCIMGIVLCITLMGIIMESAKAQGVMVCGDRMAIVKAMRDGYGERVIMQGLTMEGAAIFELLASKNGGTFTLLLTKKDGQACYIGNGENLQFLNPWRTEA